VALEGHGVTVLDVSGYGVSQRDQGAMPTPVSSVRCANYLQLLTDIPLTLSDHGCTFSVYQKVSALERGST